MSDGPFKNLRLSNDWRRFAAAAGNDAADGKHRCDLASHALVREILTDDNQALLNDLQAYSCERQLDFDPASSVESIFRRHSKTAFGDTLHKELAFRLGHQMQAGSVMEEALKASIENQSSKARKRLEEECIRARESGEMQQGDFDRTVTHANEAFDALTKDEIYDAIYARDPNAFKIATSKKRGLDEGPSL